MSFKCNFDASTLLTLVLFIYVISSIPLFVHIYTAKSSDFPLLVTELLTPRRFVVKV